MVFRVWERERKRRKKIGSRDYSYVVHLYLQEYIRVYASIPRSIYINRRFLCSRETRKKINSSEILIRFSFRHSNFAYHLSLQSRLFSLFIAVHQVLRDFLFSRWLEGTFFFSFRNRTSSTASSSAGILLIMHLIQHGKRFFSLFRTMAKRKFSFNSDFVLHHHCISSSSTHYILIARFDGTHAVNIV